jgi:transposase
MIRPIHQVRVFACPAPTDMRRGFDGLSGMVRQVIQQDPLSGALFLFRNRSRDRLKILYWDRDGLAIWYKRSERDSFQFPSNLQPASEATSCSVSTEKPSCLLDGIDLSSVQRQRRFALPEKLCRNQTSLCVN